MPRSTHVMRTASRSLTTVLLAASAVLAGCSASGPPGQEGRDGQAGRDGHALGISVVGTRADLVTGDDVLLALDLPAGAGPGQVGLTLDGRDASAVVGTDPAGRVLALVHGLPLGRSTVTASAAGATADLALTAHPTSGPVLTGPQLQPWPCLPGAADPRTCHRPAEVSWWYQPEGRAELQPYDPDDPPHDVATAPTDTGRTVPFVVRQETGTAARGQYRIAVLADPARPTTPLDPPAAWTGALVVQGGSGCGTHRGQAPAPDVLDADVLRRGIAVASSSLLHNTYSCNPVVQAEALLLLRERVAEALGPIEVAVGVGCSGGAITVLQVANAYPGLLDALVPSCSYPDSLTMLQEVQDCALLLGYWAAPARWGAGIRWTAAQMAAVTGHATTATCHTWVEGLGFDDVWSPEASDHPFDAQRCGVESGAAYHPRRNPGGVRCSVQDALVDVVGRRTDGVANRPWGNAGVVYGLRALQDGAISADQLVDLNARIGAVDIDHRWQPGRARADVAALPAVHRGGLLNQAEQLDRVPIVELRAHDPLGIHQDHRTHVLRARLDAANGHHANHVVWTGPVPVVGDPAFPDAALSLALDWADAAQADGPATAASVAAARPAAAADRCTDGAGRQLAAAECARRHPIGASPRLVAGAPPTEDVVACRLRLLRRVDLTPAVLDDRQWAALRATFPDGVCDPAVPGVGQQPTVPWLTYRGGTGGRPLPPPPTSTTR